MSEGNNGVIASPRTPGMNLYRFATSHIDFWCVFPKTTFFSTKIRRSCIVLV